MKTGYCSVSQPCRAEGRLYSPPSGLITDVDGVLAPHSSGKAYPTTRQALEMFRYRVPTGMASGKPVEYLKEFCSQNGIEADFLIGEGGGVIETAHGDRHVYRNGGSVQKFRESVYTDRKTGGLGIPFGENDGKKETIFTMFAEPQYLSELLSYVNSKIESAGYPLRAIPHPDCIDIVPVGLDKPYGIRKAGEYFGFDLGGSCAIGDGLNDIEMLQQCGTPAAPEDANPEVLDIVRDRGGLIVPNLLDLYSSFSWNGQKR